MKVNVAGDRFYIGRSIIDHVDGSDNTSPNCGHRRAYCSSPRWYTRMENHDEMIMSAEEKPLTRPTELSGNRTSSHLGASRANGRKEWEFYLVSISFTHASDCLHEVKSYDMRPPALLPLRRKSCCGFLLPSNIHRLGRVSTRDPRVHWQAH
jgi:hypothetical protein